ncbi:ABC transporter permease [Clostridioides sp. ZZV15-6598]|uniref:ABC transporter permease n=1 Tax=Clostridioides sp. ZZV15-6598 TaxID=2811501 RepID=UPI001D122246|nr:ABC transporter permease [Clostridioides sp. ZZV15-6598]
MGLLKNSLANLRGHKLRVFVALLWIIIGITSVILVSSIGNGFQKEIKKSVNNANPNKTTISFESADNTGLTDDMSIFLKPFNAKDLEELSFVEGVERIAPARDGFNLDSTYSSEASFDKKTTYLEVGPVKKDSKINLICGRDFSLDDEKRKVILLTQQSASEIFENPEDALGHGINVNGTVFEIIGVLDDSSNQQQAGGFLGGYQDMQFVTSLIPKKAFDSLMSQNSYSNEIYQLDLVCSKGYNVNEVANNIIAKLYEMHPGINGSYITPDPTEQTAYLESINSNVNKYVSIITVVAMFVGGIGVMNIMYVSVMERQREIGIRRAIGAKPRSILFQFLVEAVFITVCGGILGTIVGFIATNYVSRYIGFEAIPSLNSLLYAIMATILTGVVFGLIPAFKASKLDPIKAIYK